VVCLALCVWYFWLVRPKQHWLWVSEWLLPLAGCARVCAGDAFAPCLRKGRRQKRIPAI
jgi:hypothetical protein